MAASSQGPIHVKTGMPLASDGLTQRSEIQAMWTMYGKLRPNPSDLGQFELRKLRS
jgi:hypothetical protein